MRKMIAILIIAIMFPAAPLLADGYVIAPYTGTKFGTFSNEFYSSGQRASTVNNFAKKLEVLVEARGYAVTYIELPNNLIQPPRGESETLTCYNSDTGIMVEYLIFPCQYGGYTIYIHAYQDTEAPAQSNLSVFWNEYSQLINLINKVR